MVWIVEWRKLSKNFILKTTCELCEIVRVRCPGSMLIVVSQLPAQNSQKKLWVINTNKNLAHASSKLAEVGNGSMKLLNLHRWCISQRKSWDMVDQISTTECNMLLFVLTLKVENWLGLAENILNFD